MSNVLERIESLRLGRKHHGWLGSMGVSNTAINQLKTKKDAPSDSVISAIAKCENASIEWILTGKGCPYVTHQTQSDEEAAENILELLKNEAWSVYIVSDGSDNVAALTLKSSFLTPRNNKVFYTALEIIPNVEEKSLNVINRWATDLYSVSVDQDTFADISCARKGTWQLTNETDGILLHAKKMTMKERSVAAMPLGVNDNAAQYSSDVQEMASEFDKLTIEDKVLIKTLVKKLI